MASSSPKTTGGQQFGSFFLCTHWVMRLAMGLLNLLMLRILKRTSGHRVSTVLGHVSFSLCSSFPSEKDMVLPFLHLDPVPHVLYKIQWGFCSSSRDETTQVVGLLTLLAETVTFARILVVTFRWSSGSWAKSLWDTWVFVWVRICWWPLAGWRSPSWGLGRSRWPNSEGSSCSGTTERSLVTSGP